MHLLNWESIKESREVRHDVPSSLALPEEASGGVDGGVSGVSGPVEEEGSPGLSLSVYEVKTFLQRWEV